MTRPAEAIGATEDDEAPTDTGVAPILAETDPDAGSETESGPPVEVAGAVEPGLAAEVERTDEPLPEPEPVARVEVEPEPGFEQSTEPEPVAQREPTLQSVAPFEQSTEPETAAEIVPETEPGADFEIEPDLSTDVVTAELDIEMAEPEGVEDLPVAAGGEVIEGPAPTVGAAIAGAFAAAGTRFAFTVPGESFLGLMDGLVGAGVRVVATRHEGAAAFMAEAASQLTGRPQLVVATRAVGAANAAIGIHTARQDSTPMVALIGQVRRDVRGREAFQEVDLAGSIGNLASWSAEARDAHDALRIVGEGLRRLGRGRPGPILLSLPEDLLDEVAPDSVPESHAQVVGPGTEHTAVRKVLQLLAASERGVILAGGGVLRARSSKRLTALSEALAVPVIAAWRRPDVFPNDHPNYLGMTGYWSAPTVRQRLLDADAILVLGCRLSEVASYGYAIPGPGTPWAHVDLEPRGTGAGPFSPGGSASAAHLAAPDVAVAADAARFLDACWSALRGAALDAEMRGIRERGIAADREAYLAASRVDEGAWDGPGVHPGRVIAALQRTLPPEALITTDAGNFGGWAARGYRFTRPGTFLGPTSGAMGYGLPAAIAASLVRPDRPSVALCGDGGFAMTMSELETAVRERAHPIAIVFDNGEYGTIRMHQAREGRPLTGTALGPIDFAAVARACGALGLTVETDDAFQPALEEALAARCPVVIHLRVDPRWVSVDEVPASD